MKNSPIKWIEVIDWAPSLSHGVKDTDQNPTTSENQAQTKRTDLKHNADYPLALIQNSIFQNYLHFSNRNHQLPSSRNNADGLLVVIQDCTFSKLYFKPTSKSLLETGTFQTLLSLILYFPQIQNKS